MNPVVIDDIPFDLDNSGLAEALHIDTTPIKMARLHKLVQAARAIARPKVVYRVVQVEAKGKDYVVMDGVRLTSRVLSVNVGQSSSVYVYCATCGVELENWERSLKSPLDQYSAGAIAGMALLVARHTFLQHLEQAYRPGYLGEMNPGSLQDWPLNEQMPLFDLLGESTDSIGVQLLDNCLMFPTKTSSGLMFPAEETYYNCQLCPRDNCPARRVPYDSGLYDRKYRPGNNHSAHNGC
jgi:hypothetical protein